MESGRRIAERGGVILDIGSGPGGGYMPFILQDDPAARIIISDRSHAVAEEWKRFLDRELDSPYLCCAALDFCDIPFDSCTVDVIADHGGIINCISSRSAARWSSASLDTGELEAISSICYYNPGMF